MDYYKLLPKTAAWPAFTVEQGEFGSKVISCSDREWCPRDKKVFTIRKRTYSLIDLLLTSFFLFCYFPGGIRFLICVSMEFLCPWTK